ncbi:MAG: hypothetical protein LBH50_03430 [Spirochaetaceae bacterium]|jgi:hypothetical protein|nr:hypothetical protein [Spirochaetaceae bacterium]
MSYMLEKKNGVSSKELSKIGVSAILQFAGGAVLAVLGVLPPLISAAAGVVLTALGLSGIASRDKEDKKIGGILAVSGAAAILARYGVISMLKAAGRMVLFTGAAALIGLGLFNIVRFVLGLKKRS